MFEYGLGMKSDQKQAVALHKEAILQVNYSVCLYYTFATIIHQSRVNCCPQIINRSIPFFYLIYMSDYLSMPNTLAQTISCHFLFIYFLNFS